MFESLNASSKRGKIKKYKYKWLCWKLTFRIIKKAKISDRQFWGIYRVTDK